jgi:hypothetical protein
MPEQDVSKIWTALNTNVLVILFITPSFLMVRGSRNTRVHNLSDQKGCRFAR